MSKTHYDVAIIGSGMGALSAAALLSKQGAKIGIFEKNYLPGGCTSSYSRKGYVFESGATTLVGLDTGMPLKHLLDETGITINHQKLKVPMQVHLPDGAQVTRYNKLEDWIKESAAVFGQAKEQEQFWKYCFKVSQLVWDASVRHSSFPFSNPSDLLNGIKNFKLSDLRQLPLANLSMKNVLRKYKLDGNEQFVAFVNEQLLITAQNSVEEVNALFGSTALCYTNFGNYYVPGGMINLVRPIIDYIEQKGGALHLRKEVTNVQKREGKYVLAFKKDEEVSADNVISGIPINNLMDIGEKLTLRKAKVLPSKKLYSAFQMGIVVAGKIRLPAIHHQVLVRDIIPGIQSKSFFVSYSHPDDRQRCGPNETVLSVSSHIKDPANASFDKEEVASYIIEEMHQRALLDKESIIYQHTSGPGAWDKWTGRKYGFVGGYPQYFDTKPWQMINARSQMEGLYLTGDTTYPGQGIPGVTLSGIIAAQKLLADRRLELS